MGQKRYRVNIDEDGQVTRINVKDEKPWQDKRGHTPHRSGAGVHQDGRDRRSRTRQNQLKRSLEHGDE